MSVCTHVLQLLVLMMGFAKCFSWDIIVVSGHKQLQFYNNGTLTHTEDIPSATEIYSITYDPVHYRVLFVSHGSNKQISSFDLSTRNIQHLVTRTSATYLKVAYDPVTQLLFWREGWLSIYSFSLNPASTNKAADANLIVTFDNYSDDIAVDSCGGFIYWITNYEIERVRFDGSDREVLIHSTVWLRFSLAIDQQTQKMYWIERTHSDDNQVSIESADLNGKNRRTLYTVKNETAAGSLTVSNDFIYWHGYNQKGIWQLPKNRPQQLEAKLLSTSNNAYWNYRVIAANYTIKDQLKGNQNCETLKSLIQNESEPDCIDVMLCVHGTKVSGESRCECTQGYTGDRCDTSVCQNYCLQGNCSASVDGQPICSCNAGYSGERCQVYACHKHCLNNGVCSLNEEGTPVCQCTADNEGEICDVAICKDYCLEGNCSIIEGKPICSCNAGYSGERCQDYACHKHCLNSGVCSLNEEGAPVCQCTADFEGEICDVAICKDYCLEGNCSVIEGNPICSCKAGYSGQRCEVNACHGYCMNSGVCSLNDEGAPVCQCTADFEGKTCGVAICKDYCLDGNCSVSAQGQPVCSCKAGYSGQRCELNVCHGYCLNSGDCSLNEEDNPVCQCKIEYEGERCGVPICKDFCFQGQCNVSVEGQPICSCIDGYSGERCEFNACHDYCFNNGVCFLNEEEQTVCQCTADYEGERCDIAITHTGVCGVNMTQQILRELRSEVKQVQVIKEDLQRTLQYYSDKNDANDAKIQKCEKSTKDLENHSII